ncbi:splicing factor 3A subunit 1 [Ischnura elegans]|uniref:splicing factor 3A subunit 1 n=1 Tax=Ischnura elegans TaxID=197161 RepID=UPI001ED89929|nr:splicing factor 3A subunit 1 [Ischnura elegans]
MPSVEVSQPPSEPQPENGVPSSQPMVGIIYPPPEVRNIVDKTASFVARNGPEFEARIRQNELGNPKFNFLNAGDPYHAYYQHKVKEFKEGKGQEPTLGGGLPSVPPQKTVTVAAQLKQQEILKQVEQPFVPKDPPSEFEFVADPPSISALDLDIVKLTAQFVARNGRQFLTNLMNREQRNYQFDFLRPQHSLFQYFTKLLEQYTKVLIPPKDLMAKLSEEHMNMNVVLDQVKYRAEWIKHQEAQRRREEEEAEKERVAYAQIDWHNFVVVEKVDYQPFENGNFPPPTTPDEVGARVLMQERIEDWEDVEMQLGSDEEEEEEGGRRRGGGREERGERGNDEDEEEDEEDDLAKEAKDNTQVQDMEEESSDEEADERDGEGKNPPPLPPKEVPQPPPLPPMPDKVVVKRGYDPKHHQAAKVQRVPGPDEYLISPITGEKIPASKVQEHMRIGLLDPRWVEQRDRQIQDKLNQETVFAQGSAIEASLKQLAERRTDIFGIGDEETAIGKKIGEEDKRKDEKVTWDGHTSSVEAATRAARANITLEEQIHQIHKVKGLLPDEEKEKIGPKPNTARPGGVPQPPPPPVVPQPPPSLVPRMAPMPPPPPTGAMVPPPQQGLMMVPPMAPQLRPPPLMSVQGRPGFPMPPQGFMPGPVPAAAPQQPPQQVPPPPQPNMLKHVEVEDEPPAKKLRTEETLMPEGEFMAKNPSPVSLKVAIPSMSEKPEWRLKGQLLSLTLPLTDTVSVIKAKVHEETGMPPGKQKLHWEGIFFKDSNSLAYYNILPGTVINLQLKERGGRKK